MFFGALGEFALGEGPSPKVNFAGGTFSQPVKRAGLAVAVVATTLNGFVPLPSVQAATAFSQFSPLRGPKIVPASFVNAPLLQSATVPVFGRFSEPLRSRSKGVDGFISSAPAVAQQTYVFGKFSEPPRPRAPMFDEQQTWQFEFAPLPVPFTGFSTFDIPRFRSNAPHAQDMQVAVQFNPEFIPVPAGGTSRRLPQPEQTRARTKPGVRYGIERGKRKPEPAQIELKKPELPPIAAKPFVPEPIVMPPETALPSAYLALREQVIAAEKAKTDADNQRALDEQDIADILAILNLAPLA